MAERYVYPLTFLFVREDGGWAALACEIDVASDGVSLDQAREMLKDAVGLYVSYMIEQGKARSLARPVPPADLAELMATPREDLVTEYHALLVTAELEPSPTVTSMEFVPSMLEPVCCQHAVAA